MGLESRGFLGHPMSFIPSSSPEITRIPFCADIFHNFEAFFASYRDQLLKFLQRHRPGLAGRIDRNLDILSSRAFITIIFWSIYTGFGPVTGIILLPRGWLARRPEIPALRIAVIAALLQTMMTNLRGSNHRRL